MKTKEDTNRGRTGSAAPPWPPLGRKAGKYKKKAKRPWGSA